tara:strand:+ start:1060 stop:1293 length:234 start_codon:yes stop_codon:yes gene_type:complete
MDQIIANVQKFIQSLEAAYIPIEPRKNPKKLLPTSPINIEEFGKLNTKKPNKAEMRIRIELKKNNFSWVINNILFPL